MLLLYEALPEIAHDDLVESRDDMITRLKLDVVLKPGPNGNQIQEILKRVENCKKIMGDMFPESDLFTDQYVGPLFRGRAFSDPADDLTIRVGMDKVREFPKEMLTDVRSTLLQERAGNAVGAWLRGLHWDGVPRVATLFSVLCGSTSQDPEYLQDVSRVMLTGMVLRCLRPGTKFDYMPVLVGSQGKGKTTFWETLAGSIHGMPLHRSVHLGDFDELHRAGAKAWLLNFDEMSAARRADYVDLKNWLTLTHDSWVPKYVEHARERARTFMTAGTTNNVAFLHFILLSSGLDNRVHGCSSNMSVSPAYKGTWHADMQDLKA
jgi:hypothetical protein